MIFRGRGVKLLTDNYFMALADVWSMVAHFREILAIIEGLGLGAEGREAIERVLVERGLSEDAAPGTLGIGDPDYIYETYTLVGDGLEVWSRSGLLEMADDGLLEVWYLMEMEEGTNGDMGCTGLRVVHTNRVVEGREFSAERDAVDRRIVEAVCAKGGMKVTSVGSGYFPLDLPREWIDGETSEMYRTILEGAREVAREEPFNDDAWRRLGTALLFFGHVDEAEDALHRALVLNPTTPWPFVALGNILLHKGDEDMAGLSFRWGQEAVDMQRLYTLPPGVVDIVHPRGRLPSEDVEGGGRLCPKCGKGRLREEDDISVTCGHCEVTMPKDGVMTGMRTLPRRLFQRAGGAVELELVFVNPVGHDLVIEPEETSVNVLFLHALEPIVEVLDIGLADGTVVPDHAVLSKKFDLAGALPDDSETSELMADGGLFYILSTLACRLRHPPSKDYEDLRVFGVSYDDMFLLVDPKKEAAGPMKRSLDRLLEDL